MDDLRPGTLEAFYAELLSYGLIRQKTKVTLMLDARYLADLNRADYHKAVQKILEEVTEAIHEATKATLEEYKSCQ